MSEFLPRAPETEDMARLRESINRQCSQLMKTLDAALRLRTAPGEVQRARHMAKGRLTEFALMAMHSATLRDLDLPPEGERAADNAER